MSRFVWRHFWPALLSRSGSVFGLALLLALATLMCSPAASEREPASVSAAAAEATSVRRTAIANLQRVLSSDIAPTATPAPTPAPRPSCEGAIWWYEAHAHVGESRVIEGTVVRTRAAPDANVLLEIGQPYPDP